MNEIRIKFKIIKKWLLLTQHVKRILLRFLGKSLGGALEIVSFKSVFVTSADKKLISDWLCGIFPLFAFQWKQDHFYLFYVVSCKNRMNAKYTFLLNLINFARLAKIHVLSSVHAILLIFVIGENVKVCKSWRLLLMVTTAMPWTQQNKSWIPFFVNKKSIQVRLIDSNCTN